MTRARSSWWCASGSASELTSEQGLVTGELVAALQARRAGGQLGGLRLADHRH
jgi:hypothetical protein